ncbi:transcriptional regulator [Pantoea vagans]|nr:transcriptional regulator [Pantoea vagans]MCX3308670.1 transcriptional regulator [Pantoea vagans]
MTYKIKPIHSEAIEKYEQEHYPIEAPDPVEAIKFRMEQMGLTTKDLVPAIGRPNRVYEVLNHKRALTLPMIRNLHKMFKIPLTSLVGVVHSERISVR